MTVHTATSKPALFPSFDHHHISTIKKKALRLRIESIRATTQAGSGHPTSCCSAADIVATLFFGVMRYDPSNPRHLGNDRFILSKGHAAPLLYAAWAEAGFLSHADLLTLRTLTSDLEGHPTPRLPFVEVATGSLGQGLAAGIGLALNAKYLDHAAYRVYVLLGDGESVEGSVWEAAELARYYKLHNLCAIIDINRLGQSDPTIHGHDLEAYRNRWTGFGWHVITVDGHNPESLLRAFGEAAEDLEGPSVLLAKTIKGKGIPAIEDQPGWHGKPLSQEQAQEAIRDLTNQLGEFDGQDFDPPLPSPIQVSSHITIQPLSQPSYSPGKAVATREAFGTALAELGAVNPRIVVLDADVKNSTFTEKFAKKFPDRFFENFIAEQNMVGTAVGLAAAGKIPFAATFACFLTRAYDFIRMAAISQANIKLMGSHAGVSIGEDGPSQMGLEDLAMMAAQPGVVVLYPSDAVSTHYLVQEAANHQGMVYLRTSRPKTPILYAPDERFPIGGLKILRQSNHDQVTIATAGVTLFEALKAYDALQAEGIAVRVIDLYSLAPLDAATLLECARSTQYRVLTVEDHYAHGGLGDAVVSALGPYGIQVHKLAVREIPHSGKPDELLERYGINAAAIIQAVKRLL
ncbi:MAG: transketolase [Nitrospirae bacterium]|nr:MAG: transketolase [Nitrospirota bacterium]